ncbi:hypothetical protein NPIL_586311 [Nephila pilipes]|uniref:Uncharacterized protein n=1 Tax=Nephila pilipes TaxID=299642 RepID=A0A8X6J2U2_NEPPI|nr:hypothetical protein NPIL_586311 [Nephila pilipes]
MTLPYAIEQCSRTDYVIAKQRRCQKVLSGLCHQFGMLPYGWKEGIICLRRWQWAKGSIHPSAISSI